MNMKKHSNLFNVKRAFATALLALLFAAISIVAIAVPSSVCEANSALRYYEGRNAAGVMSKSKDSPIAVEKEELTFDIQFDEHYLNGLQIGSVSAKYTFKNTSDSEAKADVVFPVGSLKRMRESSSNDIEKFGVKINGEKVDCRLRYTVKDYDSYFNRDRDLRYIDDEMLENDFFAPDKKVFKYTYTATSDSLYCKMFFGSVDPHKIVCANGYDTWRQNLDGTINVAFRWRDGEYVFYAIGEEIDFAQRAEFYSDYNLTQKVDASLKLVSKQEITFKDLALLYFDEKYGVSEIDWYNAVFGNLQSDGIATRRDLNVYDSLYCWFEYEMNFAPAQTIVNEVVAPMYPDLDEEHSPTVYVFNYLLSPAATWKSFANLDVRVNTNYYMTESSHDFEKVEGGYVLHFDTLPQDELSFSLCSEQNPGWRGRGAHVIVDIILLSLLLPPCAIVVGLVVTIVIVKKKHGNKNGSGKSRKNKKNTHRNGKKKNADSENATQEFDFCDESARSQNADVDVSLENGETDTDADNNSDDTQQASADNNQDNSTCDDTKGESSLFD